MKFRLIKIPRSYLQYYIQKQRKFLFITWWEYVDSFQTLAEADNVLKKFEGCGVIMTMEVK